MSPESRKYVEDILNISEHLEKHIFSGDPKKKLKELKKQQKEIINDTDNKNIKVGIYSNEDKSEMSVEDLEKAAEEMKYFVDKATERFNELNKLPKVEEILMEMGKNVKQNLKLTLEEVGTITEKDFMLLLYSTLIRIEMIGLIDINEERFK